ncbi:MAG: BsuBI/PstI family type II restriction endonuclease [Thermoguttaceae bacterium]
MKNERKDYIKASSKSKTFNGKHKDIQQLINEALHIIESFGIPLENITARKLERMAMAFLAVADVKSSLYWKKAKDINDNHSMKSRDIIKYWNKHFNEKVADSSYDDVRRKDLQSLVSAGIVVGTKPDSATNNPSRGYALSPEYANLIRTYGKKDWTNEIELFMSSVTPYREKVSQKRNLKKIEIIVPNGTVLEFSSGEHNELQKEIIEKFLPHFGFGAELLYVGDAAKKHIVYDEKRLKELGFFEMEHGKLPDVVAYSREKNWLFVIEAVYSCNPVTVARKIEIEELAKHCSADIVYVSAFLDQKTFSSFASSIAWETEAWIAAIPEHIIHFNGDKFLGPYKKQ